MYNAWSYLGISAGTGGLAYLTASRTVNGKHTLRLSLDKSGSLLADVRVIGGVGCLLASYLTRNSTAKSALRTIAGVAGLSVLTTEVIRMQLSKDAGSNVSGDVRLFPAYGGTSGSQQRAYQGAWGQRAS